MTLDAADRDPSVDPGDDFYRFANGGWLDANPIPPGYGAWGSFEEVGVRNEAILHRVVEQAAEAPVDDVHRMLGDYFAAGHGHRRDRGRRARPDPAASSTWSTASPARPTCSPLLPELHRDGFLLLFGQAVTVDHDDSSANLLWLVPTGLGLPDRDAYFDDSEAAVALREAYVAHVARPAGEHGRRPRGRGGRGRRRSSTLETRLAEQQLKGEERRDPSDTLNRHTLDELEALAPGLPICPPPRGARRWATSPRSTCSSRGYMAALAGILADTDLAVLRAYSRFHVVDSAADDAARGLRRRATSPSTAA